MPGTVPGKRARHMAGHRRAAQTSQALPCPRPPATPAARTDTRNGQRLMHQNRSRSTPPSSVPWVPVSTPSALRGAGACAPRRGPRNRSGAAASERVCGRADEMDRVVRRRPVVQPHQQHRLHDVRPRPVRSLSAAPRSLARFVFVWMPSRGDRACCLRHSNRYVRALHACCNSASSCTPSFCAFMHAVPCSDH